MAVWKYRVDVRPWFHRSDLTLAEKRDAIVRAIRRSEWWRNHRDEDVEDVCCELEDAQTVDEFDAVWNDLYDVANEHRAWLETR